jgi:hypothetical protein
MNLSFTGNFSRVSFDSEIHTVTWPNGADFDPAVLHDWPAHRDSFVEAAKSWKKAPPATRE